MFGTRYVSVWFGKSRRLYTYKTKDRSISVNSVVVVPVGDSGEVKPALVCGVSGTSPTDYPRNQIKTVIGIAGIRDSQAFAGIDAHALLNSWKKADMPRRSPQIRKQKKDPRPYTIEEMIFYDDLFGD